MSKVCSKCGSVMNDTARFCNKCGTPFSKQTVEIQQQQPQNNQQQSYQQQNYQQPQSFRMGWRGLLVDSDEKVEGVLSNSYIQMAVAEEEIASSKLFFTDKRLYLQEKYFSLRHGKETKNVIVPLDEISGTQITHESPVHYFIWGGLYLLISLVLGILKASDGHGQEPGILMIVSGFFVFGIFTILFFLRRGTYFHISFPGNTLSTSVRMYSYQVIFAFQKGLQQFMKKAK